MTRNMLLFPAATLLSLAACNESSTTPTGATAASQSNPVTVNSARSSSLDRNREGDDYEGDRDDHDGRFLRLVSVFGPGQGRIRATRVPHPTTPGNFAVHFEIRIQHAKPNTAYVGQRAAEAFAPPATPPAGFDVATLTDGSCQRGLAIAPWSTIVPPPAAFTTIPDQANGLPALIITTDRHGNAAADFVFAQGFPLPLFDVTFRVIENSPAPTSMLQSDCTVLPLL
jgi:hypothetical protein